MGHSKDLEPILGVLFQFMGFHFLEFLFWIDTMSAVARQDHCCGKTRCVLWQDKISLVPSHKGIHKVARREAPRHFLEAARSAASLMSWHKRDLVLPQHTSCLATTEILSCHNRRCVYPSSQSAKDFPSSQSAKDFPSSQSAKDFPS